MVKYFVVVCFLIFVQRLLCLPIAIGTLYVLFFIHHVASSSFLLLAEKDGAALQIQTV